MEALLIIILITLIFIANKLTNIEKDLRNLETSSSHRTSTTLNPLFSEDEIENQKIIYRKWQDKNERTFDKLREIEEKEILAHNKNKEFSPSKTLTSALFSNSFAITGRNTTYRNAQRMIEANIAIINGQSIKDVSKSYYDQSDSIPWENLSIDYSVYEREQAIHETFEEDLRSRKEYWEKRIKETT